MLLDNIHSQPTKLERISTEAWPTAVAGSTAHDVKAAETHLQNFLARCPEVLPFGHFSSVFQPSVCIGREVRTKVGPIDCLFISGQGRLTVVETKLYKNPEARRDVVAQLLDYLDQMSRFSYDRLDEIAGTFVEGNPRGNKYTGLWSYVREVMGADKDPSLEEDSGWLLDEHEFTEHTIRALKRGEMLGLIVGDRIDRRAVSLVEFAKSKPGLALELGLVELAFHRPAEQSRPLVVVPTVIEQAIPIARTVVDVRVDAAGAVQVTVEPLIETQSAATGTRPPTLTSKLDFLRLVEERVGPAEKMAVMETTAAVLGRMEALAEASNGILELDYASTSANLYWRVNDDQRLRFFVLAARRECLARVWVAYFRKHGYEQLASTLVDLAQPVVPIGPGRSSGAIRLGEDDRDDLLSLVEDLAEAVVAEAQALSASN